MILYLAAIYTTGINLNGTSFRQFTEVEKQARRDVQFILESYHYVNRQSLVDTMRRDGVKVFLDSGAFSAFTQGIDIDLPAFCEYIHRNSDIIKVVSVLDGIGDPLKTYQNQLKMEALGCPALPCFHYGEDERYLEHYIANYEYITLGGMVPINKEQLRLWLDRIWNRYLTDKDGFPIRKVHGFGLTRLGLMRRYPWYSIDSSSWVQSAVNGGIMIPEIGTIFISSRSPQAKEEGRHFNTLANIEQEVIRLEIEKRGFDVIRLQNTHFARWCFNMKTFSELSNPNATPKPFKLEQQTFFP